jgi:gliding motility-associated-like protein
MKKLISGIIICFCSFYIHAQNLVPNPGFEDYTSCPTGMEQIAKAFPWKNLTLSTDYFNACNTANTFASVPYNIGGYQYPRNGDGYGAFNVFVLDGLPDYDQRDYMVTPLVTPLEKDSFYIIEFFINRSNNNIAACDCLDVWLLDSTDLVLPDPLFINSFIEGAPQLHSPKGYYLQDTLNWMRLSWTYQAKGEENLIIIGNFNTDDETDHILYSGVAGLETFYNIDDVTVKKIPEYYAQINIGNDTIICDSSLTLTLTAQPIYDSYLWNTGDTTQSITITTAGTYWVDVGFGDCIITDTIYIESRATETFNFLDYWEVCPDELPLLLTALDSMDTYLWSNGSDSAQIAITESGTYWIEATYTCGVWRDTFELVVLFPDLIDLGEDTILCNQPVFSEVLEAPSSYESYIWNTGDTTSSITVTSPGTYWVTGEYTCGQLTDTIQIINQPLLELDLGNDTTFCLGESIWLEGNAGFTTYEWNTGDMENSLEITDYGTYTLEANYPCGIEKDTIEIFLPAEIWIELPEDTVIGLGDTLTLLPIVPNGNFSYTWQSTQAVSCDSCISQTIFPTENTTYNVAIMDEYGCIATTQILVLVEERRRIFIPNAFSPNGDLNNDKFTIYGGDEVAQIQKLQIFSRWGELVFQKENFPPNDESLGWDGFFKGEKMNSNVFVVVVFVEYKDGLVEMFWKDVTLME